MVIWNTISNITACNEVFSTDCSGNKRTGMGILYSAATILECSSEDMWHVAKGQYQILLVCLTWEWNDSFTQTEHFLFCLNCHTLQITGHSSEKENIYIFISVFIYTYERWKNTYLLCASIRLSPIPFTNRDNLHEKSVSSFWNYEQKHKLRLYNSLNHTFRNDNALWKGWGKIKNSAYYYIMGKRGKLRNILQCLAVKGSQQQH